MTVFIVPETQLVPVSAHRTPAKTRRASHLRHSQRSPLTEVRQSVRQRSIIVAATATGILSVTAVASAAVMIGLSS